MSVLVLLGALPLGGCARTAAPTPETAFRLADPPVLSDDLDLELLASAIEAQRHTLSRKPDKVMRFGPILISQGEYGKALDRLAHMLTSDASEEQKLAFIKGNFDFYEVYGQEHWGEVLLTSYFEPVLQGSLRPTAAFSRPLYLKPRDLLTIPLSPFSSKFKDENALKGRVAGGKVVPYLSREEIDSHHALKGRKLEICWVDPIDAFFLHIQGSGTVRTASGREIFLTYADKNGLAYVPIGKFLKEQLAPEPVTMQGIIRVLRSMPPDERDALLNRNPSYVFFAPSTQRAITSLGVPATSGRTIAADPRFAPKGALAFMQFSKPTFSPSGPADSAPIGRSGVGRFVLDQDSGGAITGTGRIDLFWGRGADAQRFAGVLQERARVWYLVPKQ